MIRSLVVTFVTFLLSGCASTSEKANDNNTAEAAGSGGEELKKDRGSNEQVKRTSRPSISVPAEDRTFAVEAAETGLTVVSLSKLALQKGKSERVKAFATMMVEDHSAATKSLRALCAERGIMLRTNCVRCQAKLDELSALTGETFDKRYAEIMVSDHQDVFEMFKNESDEGNDTEIKKWAADKLPALQHHLSMADEMNKQVSGVNRKI